MRKSLITTAVLGALAAPSFVFAADAAPAPDLTVAYNVGLYSQYIFRGLTQTNNNPAIQGGIDLTHSSGFYLGAWASNVNWTVDSTYYTSGSLEVDLYGGYRYNFGDSGLGIDVGALQYLYPGSLAKDSGVTKPDANTTEIYGAVNYKWLQAKISSVVSDHAWTVGYYGTQTNKGEDARGTYYAELNANAPVGEWIGGDLLSGVTVIAHAARQEFSGSKLNDGQGFKNDEYSYSDYKLGLQKSFSNGVNVGAYWTKATTKDAAWTYTASGKTNNLGDDTGTVYLQKTF
jgi:uncharacterized protein (TIGR02001 family)